MVDLRKDRYIGTAKVYYLDRIQLEEIEIYTETGIKPTIGDIMQVLQDKYKFEPKLSSITPLEYKASLFENTNIRKIKFNRIVKDPTYRTIITDDKEEDRE